MTGRLRILVAAALALAGLGFAGCGHKKDIVRTADTEGVYIDVGELKYQVQISRQLNPRDTEDRAYLEGVSAADRKLARDEVLFAVFMRVQNETGRSIQAASDYEIVDTQENHFRPLAIPATNPFAYQPVTIPPKQVLPPKDSTGFNGPIQGSMVLFKLKLQSIANRPLDLKVDSREVPQQSGVINLDV